MHGKYTTSQHHTSAATHHEQAARHHRDAGRHYQAGKDYAHAAHQALLAHGHTLQAIVHGSEASKQYTEHFDNAAAKYPEPALRLPEKFSESLETTPAKRNCAEHHAAAGDAHEKAASHHGFASKHWSGKEYALAAHEARIAHSYAERSLFHGNEAAKHHVEHYGRAGPIAEIS